jgi:hypothetical protein
LGLKFGEEIWRVAFAIKDKSKSRQKWIGGQRFSARLRNPDLRWN